MTQQQLADAAAARMGHSTAVQDRHYLNAPGGPLARPCHWARRVGEQRWRKCGTLFRSTFSVKRHIDDRGEPPWATIDCECAGTVTQDGYIAKDWNPACTTCAGTGSVLDPRATATAPPARNRAHHAPTPPRPKP